MDEPPTPKPPTRARKWWIAAVGTLALIVLAGPTLVSVSPLPAALLADALPPSAGRLSAEGVGLSWFGPITVSGVQLQDPQGATLFSAERVQLEGGLIGLMAGKSAPLDVAVQGPRVELIVDPRGTNFDRVVESLKAKRGQAAGPDGSVAGNATARPVNVRVANAAALVTDTASGGRWLIDQVNADFRDPGRGVDAIELDAAGQLGRYVPDGPDRAADTGEFGLRLGAADGGGRLAKLTATAVPLSLATPLLTRFDPSALVEGLVSVEGQTAWTPPAAGGPVGRSPAEVVRQLVLGGVRSSGIVKLSAIQLSGAATRGGPVALSSVDIPWRVSATGDALAINQLDLTSDLGRVTVQGTIAPAEVERWSTGSAAAPNDLHVLARLDLDRVARSAPQLVRLREGAQIDSGRIEAQADFQRGSLSGSLKTGSLAGVAEGRRVAWREPLDLQFAARQQSPAAGPAGWALESLRASSSFFHATASGGAERLTGSADFDLDRLAGELGGLFDLRDAKIAGRGRARCSLTRDPARRRWRLEGRGALESLLVGDPQAPLASEPKLDFQATLDGDLDATGRLPVGAVSLTAGDDVLSVTLPAADAQGVQAFEVRLAGDVARWFRRARVSLPGAPRAEEIGLRGSIEVSAAGKARGRSGVLDRMNVALKGLSVDTESLGSVPWRLRVQNERVEASGAGSWDAEQGLVLQIDHATAASSVASGRARDVVVSLATPERSQGEALYRIDLGQLGRWVAPRGGASRYATTGGIEGSVKIGGSSEGLALNLHAEGVSLAITDRTAPAPQATVWSEPRLTVDADAVIAAKDSAYSVDIRDARVASRSVNGSFGGQVADAVAMRGVSLSGGVDYDLEQLTPVLWPSLGDGVKLVGRDRATFRVETDESNTAAAPLARLRGSFAAPWEGADLFGLPVGAGRLAGSLQRGVLRVDPLDVAIGGGRLTAQPIATLDPPPASISLPAGPLVTEVAVSQEVNERILKFIAPVLADAARIEGRFSLSLSDFDALLQQRPGAPPAARATGVLDVHQARLMPGPAVGEWVGLIERVVGLARDGVQSALRPGSSVLVAIEDSSIEFQLVDGRVYHRGLVFYVGDARVESSGSVGLDETLNLVLAVPILDQWVDQRPQFLGRLRGQSLKIPVTGTFSRPKINNSAFQELSGQFLESAAAGAVEGGLNLLLERLRSR